MLRDIASKAAGPLLAGTAACSSTSAATLSDAGQALDADDFAADAYHCADYPSNIPDAAPFWDGAPLIYLDDDEVDASDGEVTVDAGSADEVTPDGGPCEFFAPVPCDVPRHYGWLSYDQCQRYCSPISRGNCMVKDDEGTPVLSCMLCGGGRRPRGFSSELSSFSGSSAFATWLAAMAELEAASVHSFERLARELEAHGAPRELVIAALRAADDERRHADMMTRAATSHGTTVPPRKKASLAVRPPFDVALENAVEGCVFETYGALVASVQAMRATEPGLRSMMSVIASDETNHAILAWRVAKWFDSRLNSGDRQRIEGARSSALSALEARACFPVDRDLISRAGLPSVEVARRLAHGLATISRYREARGRRFLSARTKTGRRA
jgi:hypothetical protein